MIIGIGMDLVEIDRIAATLQRHGERALQRLFTTREASYCQGSRSPVESFGARFAAKEALFKALGTGWTGGVAWHEVEVLPDAAGAPRLHLHGRTLEVATGLGVRRSFVSLTHTSTVAGAYVVLEGDSGPGGEE